jgi:NAD(P)-dependent dehydrogenase (short-subunit alcohol dehydrogenase family)
MQLKFLQPIHPPARLKVSGTIVAERGETGRVTVDIVDAHDGRRYVEASYEFSRHRLDDAPEPVQPITHSSEPVVLVTGASGGIGQALLRQLGPRGVAVQRGENGMFDLRPLEQLQKTIGDHPVAGIVHLGWPSPDNTRLTKLSVPSAAIANNIAQPLELAVTLAQTLARFGTSDALLLLVGSTAAEPGRHNYRSPLYTLGKSLIPPLTRILAVELGPSGRRCASVVFDAIEAGMNKGMSAQAKVAHESRSPVGMLPTADEAASQLLWVLSNSSFLVSGTTVTLSGGAIP